MKNYYVQSSENKIRTLRSQAAFFYSQGDLTNKNKIDALILQEQQNLVKLQEAFPESEG